MGKKRKAKDLMAGKSFVGKHGNEVEPKFRASKKKGGLATVMGVDSAADGSGEEDFDESDYSEAEAEEHGEAEASLLDEGSEEDEEAARELALEIAALNSSRLEAASARGELGTGMPQSNRRPFKNEVTQMAHVLDNLVMRGATGKKLGYVEVPATTGPKPAQDVVPDFHDDLQREATFYSHALQGVTVAFKRLDEIVGVGAYLRPNDYYAEMIKTDEHMSKVKDKLLLEKTKIEEKDIKRTQRENRKLGKKIQAEKVQQKHKKKQSDLASIKAWRSDKKRGGDVSNEGAVEAAINGTYKKGGAQFQGGGRKAVNDAKYGHGGLKRRQKQNNRESSNDMSQYSGRKNASRPSGISAAKKSGGGLRVRSQLADPLAVLWCPACARACSLLTRWRALCRGTSEKSARGRIVGNSRTKRPGNTRKVMY